MVAPRGVAESERFVRALINIAAQGLRTNCSDSATHHLWLSEQETERAQAARRCHGCPVLRECDAAAAARREVFGVWAGRDFSQRHWTQPAAGDA